MIMTRIIKFELDRFKCRWKYLRLYVQSLNQSTDFPDNFRRDRRCTITVPVLLKVADFLKFIEVLRLLRIMY